MTLPERVAALEALEAERHVHTMAALHDIRTRLDALSPVTRYRPELKLAGIAGAITAAVEVIRASF